MKTELKQILQNALMKLYPSGGKQRKHGKENELVYIKKDVEQYKDKMLKLHKYQITDDLLKMLREHEDLLIGFDEIPIRNAGKIGTPIFNETLIELKEIVSKYKKKSDPPWEEIVSEILRALVKSDKWLFQEFKTNQFDVNADAIFDPEYIKKRYFQIKKNKDRQVHKSN